MTEMTLGGANLPLPGRDGIGLEYIPFGTARRMANGTYRVDYVTGRIRITVRWQGLTAAERATLWAGYGGYIATAAVVVMPDGQTYTVMTGLGSWREQQWYDFHDTPLYDVAFVLEQV